VCHVLNRHASFCAVYEYGLLRLTVERHAKVKLFFDCNLFNDVDAVAWEASISRLFSNKCLSAHFISDFYDLLRCLHDVHSSLEFVLFEVAETTSTSKHLSLHYKLWLFRMAESSSYE